MPKIKLVKKKTNEMSGTGGSASATPGTGAQYAAPKAFPRVASDYNKTFGTHFAPSIPNRPSKAITYKELWEQEITTVSDIIATSALDAGKRLTIPKGSKVQVVKKRLENEPTVTQLKYNGQLVNVNAGPFINQYLFKETSKPEVKEGELKLGVKYDYKGNSGFISTGGSNDPRDWKFLSGKKPDQYPYLAVKADLVPSEKQPGKYDGAFDMGLGKGHHIDEAGNEYDSLAGILKQLGAEDDAVKVLIKAVEMGALKPSDTVTIIKKSLGKIEDTDIDESLINEAIEIPTWLAGKLEDVHTKPGQGSIFAKSVADVLKIAQNALDKEQNIDKIANSTGTLTIKSPGIGYNLVLPIEKAKALPGAKESEVEKVEGPNKIKVPAITTNAPLTQFKTDELTVIVRPKKDDKGTVIPNEYIVLSAFPGDPTIPRASEWGGKYAVVIPSGKDIKEIVNEVLTKLKAQDNPLIKEAYYTEFKKMTQVRTPGEQLHRAIREIRRKIDEINKLVSYTEKMKTEMKSDVNEVRYLNRTKEALAKISARIQETNNKIKHLVQ